MIELIITATSQGLDLSPNQSVTIDYQNPMFKFDVSGGDYSLPFNIPITSRNKIILDHLEELTIQSSLGKAIPCHIKSDGHRVMDGLLYIDEVSFDLNNHNAGYYRASVVGVEGNFLQKIVDKNIRDFDYGVTSCGGSLLSYATSITNSGSNTIHAFPTIITDRNFASDTNEKNMEPYTLPLLYVLNFWNDTASAFLLSDNSHLVPCLRVKYIFDTILTQLGYTYSGSFLGSNEFEKLFFANNVLTFSSAGQLINNNYVPDISCIDFFKSLLINFGLIPFAKSLTHIEFKTLSEIVASNKIKDWTPKVNPQFTRKQNENGYTFSFKMDGEDEAYTTQINPLLKPTHSYSEMEIVPWGATTPTLSRQLNAWIHHNSDFDNLYPYIFKKGEKQLQSQIVPVCCDAPIYPVTPPSPIPDVGLFWSPVIDMQYTDAFALNYPVTGTFSSNSFQAKMMYYHGLQTLVTTYPYASNHNRLGFGILNSVMDVKNHLGWWGSEGLFDTYWKPFLEKKSNPDYLSSRAIIHYDDLLNWDWTEQKRFVNQNFFIKKIRVEFPLRKSADLELF